MTAAERILWNSLSRRTADMTPQMAAAIFAAFQTIRESFTDQQLQRIVELGFGERLFNEAVSAAVLATAFQPVRDVMRSAVVRNFRYTATTSMPMRPAVAKQLAISFDVLNPKVIDAIRMLETRVIAGLQEGTREIVRAYVENGLRDGRIAAAELRSVIGLGPSQLQEVQNFRDALQGLNGRTLDSYSLRNRRYDAIVARGEMTPERIERAVAHYRDARIRQNAETVAGTATL